MRTIIIDDEEMSRKSLKRFCDKIDDIEVIGDYENPVDALKVIGDNQIDLIFLDIHMPDFSGFDLLKTQPKLPSVIITTTDKSLALDAFEFNVSDYLIKPVNLPRLIKAIEKVKMQNQNGASEVEANHDHIYVNIDRRLVKIILNDLLVVEARGDYIVLKTEEKNFIVHSTMKNMEDKLPSDKFLKVHRSFIINLNKIVDIEDNSVLIKREIVPVSRANRKALTDRLNLI